MRRVVAPSRRAVRAQRAEERRDARRGRPLASRVRVAEWRYPVARVPRRDVRVPRDPECGAFSMFDRPPGPVRAAGAWTWPPCAASSCGAPRRIASLREAPRARRAFAAYATITLTSKLLAKSAFFDVPNVKPFGHLGGDIAPTVTDSIADLKYVQLIKALHVCIIDVAAMADMTRIAISAFLLKQRNVWAL